MPNGNRFGLACCCSDDIHPPPCMDGEITVIAGQDCGDDSVDGAFVTLKLGTTTIGTCTTASVGCTFTGLSPGVYTVIVVFDGVTKMLTATVNSDCTPITVTTESFGQSYIEIVVQGCNGWIGGADFDVYQSGVLLGSGTSLDSLIAPPYVRINFPTLSDGTNFTIITSLPPYFVGPGTTTVPSGTCQANANPGTINSADGYGCCGSPFLTTTPYGPTLTCTIGGHTITLSATGGLWSGTLSASVPGRQVTCLPGGTNGNVTACLHVSWSCGGLAVSYLGCPGGSCTGGAPPAGTIVGRPLASDCTATPNVTCTSSETSHVAEPLFSTGTIFCPLGNSTSWTVTQP